MIRPIQLSDIREVATFYSNIRLDTVPLVHSVDEICDYIREVSLPRQSSVVYEQDGVVLAWMDVYGGWLDQLYCRRGATGHGIGKVLVDHAKSISPSGLQLYTFQVNRGARAFYAREGFVEVEFGDGSQNEEHAPDVRLEWRARFAIAD